LPRVQGACNAPDGTAFASGVRALKRADQRAALEARIAHQLGQAPLPARQLALIRLVGQLQAQIKLREHIAAVGIDPHHRRHR